jgi:hypothetical protein
MLYPSTDVSMERIPTMQQYFFDNDCNEIAERDATPASHPVTALDNGRWRYGFAWAVGTGTTFASPAAAIADYHMAMRTVVEHEQQALAAWSAQCHYCGQPVASTAIPNALGVYQCQECR